MKIDDLGYHYFWKHPYDFNYKEVRIKLARSSSTCSVPRQHLPSRACQHLKFSNTRRVEDLCDRNPLQKNCQIDAGDLGDIGICLVQISSGEVALRLHPRLTRKDQTLLAEFRSRPRKV